MPTDFLPSQSSCAFHCFSVWSCAAAVHGAFLLLMFHSAPTGISAHEQSILTQASVCVFVCGRLSQTINPSTCLSANLLNQKLLPGVLLSTPLFPCQEGAWATSKWFWEAGSVNALCLNLLVSFWLNKTFIALLKTMFFLYIIVYFLPRDFEILQNY